MATEPWLEVAFEGKGQQNESCRLLLFREKPRLQNLSTGELLDLEVGSELHEARSCLVMRSQGEEDPADVKEIFLKGGAAPAAEEPFSCCRCIHVPFYF